MSELAPHPGAVPRPLSARELATSGAVAAVVAAAFWLPLLLGGALRGGDWSTHHFHYFDWVRTSLVEHGTLPLYMADAWVTPNFLANAESPGLAPWALLLAVLPTGAYVKSLIVAFTALGLVGMFWLLRDLAVALPMAAFGAVVWSFNGFFVSHVTVGHHWAMGCWSLPALLFLARRGVLGSDRALALAAGLNAVTILGGQHQAFIWQNIVLVLFAALWCLDVRSPLPALRIGLVVAGAAGLAAVKLLPMWQEFGSYAPQARIQGLPPSTLLLSLLARRFGRDHVDPAVTYEHGAGWWEYAFYLGGIPLLLLLPGAVAASRRCWPILVIGLFFLVLALEPSAPRRWIEDLPVWRTQRNPARFLLIAIFALCVAGPVGLDRLRLRLGLPWAPRVSLVVSAFVGVVGLDLFLHSEPWQRSAVGSPIESRAHVPKPERAGGELAWLELRDFSPNRLGYRVETLRAARLVIPVRYGRTSGEWDASPYRTFRHTDGHVAIEVPAGRHDVVLRYRPPGMGAGLAISLATAALGSAALLVRRRAAS